MSEIATNEGTTTYYKDWTTNPGQITITNTPVLEAINRQVNAELLASHQYLAMAAFCERRQFTGAARWLRHQSLDERQHALRLLDFVVARNGASELEAIPAPTIEFKDILDVFVAALLQEERTTSQINELYELALESKAFAEMAELQWFVTEQVLAERTARQWVARLELAANDPASLLEVDRELGAVHTGN